ncbi:MAG: insulinase family protein [Rickettsiales bacterium]|nr:insulinase family protein [Rickettsiales bacterium]
MRHALAIFCLLGALIPSLGQAGDAVHSTVMTLENGLQVVVVEQHYVPAVAHMLLVRAGSAEDPRGQSGLAHYLEHMLFKGTESISEEAYNQQIASLGGEHNAYTDNDVTAYYVLVARKNLADVMALESERFLHWQPKAAVYASERDVIVEERRLRTENQPSALLSEAMGAALYQNHPYHTPVIGWLHEMQQLSPQNAKDFFATYYQPKNATLLLVGDITPADARDMAENYYGEWKNTREVPARVWPSEPPQRGSLLVKMSNPTVQQPLWRRYYKAPSLRDGQTSEAIPLMLLADMLGAEGTGLLYKALVETGKATTVSVGYSPFSIGPTEFSVSMIPATGVTPEALSEAYEAALAKILHRTQFTEAALQRAKTQLKAATIFSQDGLDGQAFLIAQLLTLGMSAEEFAALPQKIDAVSLAQVSSAAAHTMIDHLSVTGYLLPDNKAAAPASKTPILLQETGRVH